jgi:hypothetical protein
MGVGAGENAISIMSRRSSKGAGSHFTCKKGATDLAKFTGCGLSNARQPL